MNAFGENKDVLSISEVCQQVRDILNLHLPILWVEGEISNLSRPASGHWYLTLKDQKSQVSCAMFRNRNQNVHFIPDNGMQIIVRCKPDLYATQGKFQLIIEEMEETGSGALQRQFEKLKIQLQKEGLFDNRYKQDLPKTIKQIGIITSPTGAAIQDILSVLKRRFPATKVSVFPSLVQGKQAAASIIEAIEFANRHNSCDVLVISRGGGSLEDLWPFNEEDVARAIFESRLPIVSAIGHEVDFTISDFVADLRAATPSAAAEILSPDANEVISQYEAVLLLLHRTINQRIQNLQQKTDFLGQRLRDPITQLNEQNQQLRRLHGRLTGSMSMVLKQQRHQYLSLKDRLRLQSPSRLLPLRITVLKRLINQLSLSTKYKLRHSRQHFEQTLHLMNTVSPLTTLGRGYAILRDGNGSVVKSVEKIEKADELKAHIRDGEIFVVVTDTRKRLLDLQED